MSRAEGQLDGQVYSAELPAGAADSARAVAEVADAWDAQWDPDETPGGGAPAGGRLVMPRVAGVHRGVLTGRLDLMAGEASGVTRAVYRVEEAHDRVHGGAVTILVISALGAILTVIWPIWPQLLPVAPFGALLALGGWFLVVSRLQNAGPEEFLRQVNEELDPGEAPAEPAAGERS